jgi:hypothetical protein
VTFWEVSLSDGLLETLETVLPQLIEARVVTEDIDLEALKANIAAEVQESHFRWLDRGRSAPGSGSEEGPGICVRTGRKTAGFTHSKVRRRLRPSFFTGNKSWVPHSSPVFGLEWDTTAPDASVVCHSTLRAPYPTQAQKQGLNGAPNFCYRGRVMVTIRAQGPVLKES